MNKTTTGGQSLTASKLSSTPLHIPNDEGGSFKTELVIHRDPNGTTEKILWWHEDDPRKVPHNHPWDFVSTILDGGYTEHRWWKVGDEVHYEINKYVAGDKNTVPSNVFHIVTDILPNTRTHLLCGIASKDNEWGYLDIDSGEYTRAINDPDFRAKLISINPHLK